MNPHLMNPAGRLWALLVHSGTRGDGDESVLSVWADYLGMPPEYSSELYAALSAIAALPGRIREAVASGGVPAGEEEHLLAAAATAEAALRIAGDLHAPVSELRARVDPGTLAALKHASVSLNIAAAGAEPFRVPPAEALAHAADRLAELAPVEARDDRGTEALLRGQADRIRLALRLMVVAGPEAVRDALEGMVGRLALSADAIAAIRESVPLSEAVRAVLTALSGFGQAPVRAAPRDWQTLSALMGDD